MTSELKDIDDRNPIPCLVIPRVEAKELSKANENEAKLLRVVEVYAA